MNSRKTGQKPFSGNDPDKSETLGLLPPVAFRHLLEDGYGSIYGLRRNDNMEVILDESKPEVVVFSGEKILHKGEDGKTTSDEAPLIRLTRFMFCGSQLLPTPESKEPPPSSGGRSARRCIKQKRCRRCISLWLNRSLKTKSTGP